MHSLNTTNTPPYWIFPCAPTAHALYEKFDMRNKTLTRQRQRIKMYYGRAGKVVFGLEKNLKGGGKEQI